MQHLEKYLVELDSGPSSAVSRVTLGLCIPPAFRALSGAQDQIWIDLALFLALLIGLRVGPAVLRKLLPFSAEARNIWSDRRQIAKVHDSYQWQKLFWIGIGIALYLIQLITSTLWLRHFRFGPAEWFWRSLTYGTRIR